MRHYLISLTAVATLTAITGCQAPQAFQQSLTQATQDISQGQLDSARSSLMHARSLASGPRDRQKVDDLNAIVDGAQAMISGRATSAAQAWSRVQDPDLRKQIQREANAMGLDLDGQPQENLQ